MTTIKRSSKGATVEALVASDPDLIKALMKQALQEAQEGEMTVSVHACWTLDGQVLTAVHWDCHKCLPKIGRLHFRTLQKRSIECPNLCCWI